MEKCLVVGLFVTIIRAATVMDPCSSKTVTRIKCDNVVNSVSSSISSGQTKQLEASIVIIVRIKQQLLCLKLIMSSPSHSRNHFLAISYINIQRNR